MDPHLDNQYPIRIQTEVIYYVLSEELTKLNMRVVVI